MPGGFGSMVKGFASQALEQAGKAVDSAKASVVNAYSYPTRFNCIPCAKDYPLPDGFWDWTCAKCQEQKSSNESKCAKCQVPRQHGTPTMECPDCKTMIKVPTTNFKKDAVKAGHTAKDAAKAAPGQIKAAYAHAKSAPTQFNCKNCAVLLDLPTDPWVCGNCKNENAFDTVTCQGDNCESARPPTSVMCGVCSKPTEVPKNNFLNQLHYAKNAAERSSKKVFYTVSQKPFITCSSCQQHVTIPPREKVVMAAADSGEGADAAPVEAKPLTIACTKCSAELEYAYGSEEVELQAQEAAAAAGNGEPAEQKE